MAQEENTYRAQLLSALKSIPRSGSYAAGGILKTCLPGLCVPALGGGGQVALPLLPSQAKELASICNAAPFGRKEATIYDENVRKCLQLGPKQIVLRNPEWHLMVDRLANGELRKRLGLPENLKVVPELYKLLLYEVGGRFTPHRDTEKAAGMFATLVIVLPSPHAGGELLVRHAGNEERFDFGSQGLFNMFYASFYADCEHEILPVREGYRLALVYNLIGQGPMRSLTPADNSRSVQKILKAITAWLQDPDAPQKLVIPLEHQYCEQSFSFDKLKGKDCAAADVLRQAAVKAPQGIRIQCYLGMLKKTESGPAEVHYGDDEGCLVDVEDSETELTNIVAPSEDDRVPDFTFDESELLPEDYLECDGLEWTNGKVQEATGNAGCTMERWYHQVALIIWPTRRKPSAQQKGSTPQGHVLKERETNARTLPNNAATSSHPPEKRPRILIDLGDD
ncbi:hypothetical protein KFL_000830330 [Klebsormidium nitens]|uniref:Fe2OG dioxygenase domain-containing protein n=1 Tax=Klebsormidium nitens TaxID=105231 RepID=A0A1Y1HX52_KLENI|nr:hypothetical protein KFL_000830330 [Klebsormidium nitens]|eukprot:GAQ81551.1 hypothetical protein KFL_000830330 [Klebsormidium nitens]